MTHSAAADICHVQLSTLTVCGEKTTAPDRRITEILREQMPKCRYIIIPGADHMSPLSHPELIGVRPSGRQLEVWAPFGTDDLFNLVVRPNRVQITPAIYDAKVTRWVARWPSLVALTWRRAWAAPVYAA